MTYNYSNTHTCSCIYKMKMTIDLCNKLQNIKYKSNSNRVFNEVFTIFRANQDFSMRVYLVSREIEQPHWV